MNTANNTDAIKAAIEVVKASQQQAQQQAQLLEMTAPAPVQDTAALAINRAASMVRQTTAETRAAANMQRAQRFFTAVAGHTFPARIETKIEFLKKNTQFFDAGTGYLLAQEIFALGSKHRLYAFLADCGHENVGQTAADLSAGVKAIPTALLKKGWQEVLAETQRLEEAARRCVREFGQNRDARTDVPVALNFWGNTLQALAEISVAYRTEGEDMDQHWDVLLKLFLESVSDLAEKEQNARYNSLVNALHSFIMEFKFCDEGLRKIKTATQALHSIAETVGTNTAHHLQTREDERLEEVARQAQKKAAEWFKIKLNSEAWHKVASAVMKLHASNKPHNYEMAEAILDAVQAMENQRVDDCRSADEKVLESLDKDIREIIRTVISTGASDAKLQKAFAYLTQTQIDVLRKEPEASLDFRETAETSTAWLAQQQHQAKQEAQAKQMQAAIGMSDNVQPYGQPHEGQPPMDGFEKELQQAAVENVQQTQPVADPAYAGESAQPRQQQEAVLLDLRSPPAQTPHMRGEEGDDVVEVPPFLRRQDGRAHTHLQEEQDVPVGVLERLRRSTTPDQRRFASWAVLAVLAVLVGGFVVSPKGQAVIQVLAS